MAAIKLFAAESNREYSTTTSATGQFVFAGYRVDAANASTPMPRKSPPVVRPPVHNPDMGGKKMWVVPPFSPNCA